MQEKLKNIRLQKKWSISKASKNIGISPTLLYYLEIGRNEPTVQTIKKICKCYNISSDWLLDIIK